MGIESSDGAHDEQSSFDVGDQKLFGNVGNYVDGPLEAGEGVVYNFPTDGLSRDTVLPDVPRTLGYIVPEDGTQLPMQVGEVPAEAVSFGAVGFGKTYVYVSGPLESAEAASRFFDEPTGDAMRSGFGAPQPIDDHRGDALPPAVQDYLTQHPLEQRQQRPDETTPPTEA